MIHHLDFIGALSSFFILYLYILSSELYNMHYHSPLHAALLFCGQFAELFSIICVVFHRANVFNFDEVIFLSWVMLLVSCLRALQALHPEDFLLIILLKVLYFYILHYAYDLF